MAKNIENGLMLKKDTISQINIYRWQENWDLIQINLEK